MVVPDNIIRYINKLNTYNLSQLHNFCYAYVHHNFSVYDDVDDEKVYPLVNTPWLLYYLDHTTRDNIQYVYDMTIRLLGDNIYINNLPTLRAPIQRPRPDSRVVTTCKYDIQDLLKVGDVVRSGEKQKLAHATYDGEKLSMLMNDVWHHYYNIEQFCLAVTTKGKYLHAHVYDIDQEVWVGWSDLVRLRKADAR